MRKTDPLAGCIIIAEKKRQGRRERHIDWERRPQQTRYLQQREDTRAISRITGDGKPLRIGDTEAGSNVYRREASECRILSRIRKQPLFSLFFDNERSKHLYRYPARLGCTRA